MTGDAIRRAFGAAAVIAACVPTATVGQLPQFRGSVDHTGVVRTTGLEHLGGVVWTYRTEGAVRSSPALVDGTVYVGSGDGFLYALDAATGALVWRFDAGSPIASSPAVADGVVLAAARDGVLHGVDGANGSPRWSLETGPDLPLPWGQEGWDYYLGSPALAGGLAYWGSGDGTMHALDPETGAVRWRVEVDARIRSTAAVSGDDLVFGDSNGRVHALDARTGARRWTFETDGVGYDSSDFGYDRRQISASPAIVGDEVFVGSRDATLYVLDARDGSERWRFSEPSAWVIATTAVDDTRVFSARSSSGNVRAIDRATGSEIWSFASGSAVFASPILIDGVLYLGRSGGELSAHDAGTGETLWSYQTGASVYATPAIHDGRAYVGNDAGVVFAFAGASTGWRRAVFFDEARSEQSVLGREPEHVGIPDFFESRGYERLRSADLAGYLQDRVDDRATSVVVFGMDAVPPDVIDGQPSLLRRYLDAGGRAVWMGFLPGQLVYDDEGRITALDRDRSSEILDVDFSSFDGDRYSVHPTEAGRAWGLESWWVGSAETMPEHVTEVLAVNELGRTVSWVKRYGGAAGSGFVRVRSAWDPVVLAEIQRVAERGLGGVSAGR